MFTLIKFNENFYKMTNLALDQDNNVEKTYMWTN